MPLGPRINDAILGLVTLEHYVDPLFRDSFNALFQRPLADVAQFLLRHSHSNPETQLCQEIPSPAEAELATAITASMESFTQREYQGRIAERAGNTKTYGVVRGDFEVLPNVQEPFRKGLFAHAK